MSSQTLTNHHILLLPLTEPLLEAMLLSPTSFYELCGYNLSEGYTEFPEAISYTLDYIRTHPDIAPWSSYGIIHLKDKQYIGMCGYKSRPINGVVEIGYEIIPAYRNFGFATMAAGLLIDFAFNRPPVQKVIAHTLGEENASNTLLRKLGFVFVGEQMDDDEGIVWAWELAKTSYILTGATGSSEK